MRVKRFDMTGIEANTAEILKALAASPMMYILFLEKANAPVVYGNPETNEKKVFIYHLKEDAENGAKQFGVEGDTIVVKQIMWGQMLAVFEYLQNNKIDWIVLKSVNEVEGQITPEQAIGKMCEAITVQKLIGLEYIYVLISKCTNLPFVQENPETADDEALIFESEEAAMAEAKRLSENQNPVGVAKVGNDEKHMVRLGVFSPLRTMGVNTVAFNYNTENEFHVELDRFVKKPGKTTPKGEPWIENPALHLTAIYFMQELRGKNLTTIPDYIKDMKDEIVAHYSQGNFLTIYNEKGGIPLLKFPNGDSYMPLFTDRFEAQKFRIDQEVKLVAIYATEIPSVLPKDAKGVVVNPNGVNLQLPIIRTAVNPDDVLKK